MDNRMLTGLLLSMLCMLAFGYATPGRAEWSSMESGTVNELRGVWGSSATDIFTVGVGGIILHYDGNQEGIWYPMQNSSS